MSDITLTTGMSQSLSSLQNIDKLMTRTNERLATGKKINSALDDPINYFSAEDHTQRASSLQSRKDEMSEGVQTISAADAGISAMLDLIEAAESLANSALSAESQAEINTLEDEFNEILTQLDSIVEDSGYKGVNLLGGTSETLDIYFEEGTDSSITLTGFDASCAGLGITSLTADDWADDTDTDTPDKTAINTTLDLLSDAKDSLRTESKTLSIKLSTITVRQSFASSMIDILEEGAANLVNADMDEESANLLTLQTQQSLATTSLSIASDAAQSVLKLF